MKTLLNALPVVALSSTFNIATATIDTVDSLDVSKYIGRWYQVYGNEYTARTITRNSTCIAADYGLDEETGNITVINSSRLGKPTGPLNTITGYAYTPDSYEPGQLKVVLGQVPFPGDYWVAGLGPATFSSDELYQWSIVTGPAGEDLFILARDVDVFEAEYSAEVLDFVESLGFTGAQKEPQEIVQEGCLPFDPSTDAFWLEDAQEFEENADEYTLEDEGVLAEALEVSSCGCTYPAYDHLDRSIRPNSLYSPPSTVKSLDLSRYEGRWYQAYSSYTVSVALEKNGACVTADYAKNSDGTVAVTNTARAKSVDGELIVMNGYAYYEDSSEPGKLKVNLEGVPVDGPYWVLALGEENGEGAYPWAVVSDPYRAFLFVLVRDPDSFSGSDTETEVLEKCKALGFDKFWNSPRKTVQEGCTYTEGMASSNEKSPDGVGMTIAADAGGRDGQEPVETLGGPAHASCKVNWSFSNDNCESVSNALVAAAEDMSGLDGCDGGNKCGYTVGEVSQKKAEFVHETSVAHYLDNIEVTFKSQGDGCEAKAFSTSQTWYAVLDFGVNYCNLHNLVEATGLSYKETGVSDATCTQYSSADCERY